MDRNLAIAVRRRCILQISAGRLEAKNAAESDSKGLRRWNFGDHGKFPPRAVDDQPGLDRIDDLPSWSRLRAEPIRTKLFGNLVVNLKKPAQGCENGIALRKINL
jgi:hypothetical protein